MRMTANGQLPQRRDRGQSMHTARMNRPVAREPTLQTHRSFLLVGRALALSALAVVLAGCVALNNGVLPTPTGLVTLPPEEAAIPSQVAGERVYRAVDLAILPTSGTSFLFGGPVTHSSLYPPCPSGGRSTAQDQGLLASCGEVAIDGLPVSSAGGFDAPDGELVIVRVHENDPRAASCVPELHPKCAAAMVVESVVWKS